MNIPYSNVFFKGGLSTGDNFWRNRKEIYTKGHSLVQSYCVFPFVFIESICMSGPNIPFHFCGWRGAQSVDTVLAGRRMGQMVLWQAHSMPDIWKCTSVMIQMSGWEEGGQEDGWPPSIASLFPLFLQAHYSETRQCCYCSELYFARDAPVCCKPAPGRGGLCRQ